MENIELFEPFKYNFEYFFYRRYIAHLEEKYNIKIMDIMKYIKKNNVELRTNYLALYLFEKNEIHTFNRYSDLFINNSWFLQDLKIIINMTNSSIDKNDIISKINNRMDNDINIIVREIISKKYDYDFFKEQEILPYITRLIYELCNNEKIKYHDIKYVAGGDYSDCYRIGDKILKIGNKRETFFIRNHRRFLQPLIRKEVKTKDGNFMCCLEINQAVDMNNITNKDVYEVYKDLRDDGIIWADAKISNVGRLIGDNKIFFNDIDYVDKSGTGFLTDADYSLKAGDLVVVDNDQMYDADEIDYITNDNYLLFEERYQNEKRNTK